MQVRRRKYRKLLKSYEENHTEKSYRKNRVKSSMLKHAQYKTIWTSVQLLFCRNLSKLLSEEYTSTNAHVDQYNYFFSDGKTTRGSHRNPNYSSTVANLRKRSTWLSFVFLIAFQRYIVCPISTNYYKNHMFGEVKQSKIVKMSLNTLGSTNIKNK